MIIDVHNHIGQDVTYGIKQSADELLEKMDRGGIDKAVIFPLANIVDLDVQNGQVEKAVKGAPDRFVGFAAVNPWNESETQKTLDADWVAGAAIDVEVFSVNLVHPKVNASLEAALERGLPVFINSDHPMSRVSTNMAEWIETVARKYPELKIVLRPTIPGIQGVAQDNPNIVFDTSAIHADLMLTRMTALLGAHRILLGSDSPKEHPYVKRVLVETAKISDRQKDMILGQNAARFLLGSSR